jgi:uncharacterized protein
MSLIPLEKIKETVITELGQSSPVLYYHNLHHTLDVLEQTIRIADEENIKNREELMLLEIAALYHDVGYLNGYKNHEEKSCVAFKTQCHNYDFSSSQIAIICDLIMATKIPQQPATHLEKIICDADLDYLGRDDFFSLGDCLRREFLALGIVATNDDWEILQYNFLKNHTYFTNSSIAERGPSKMEHFKIIESRLRL